jgi:hypothetical protein
MWHVREEQKFPKDSGQAKALFPLRSAEDCYFGFLLLLYLLLTLLSIYHHLYILI